MNKLDTNKMALDVNEVMEAFCVGKNTADKIGKEAGAIFKIGRRKLFSVSKLQAYIDKMTETAPTEIKKEG